MKRLMDSPALLAELGETARKRWQEQFTWYRIADRYEAILRDAASPQHQEQSAEPPVDEGGVQGEW
jgi:glycosyltransferase involved in cell wall biosynthesis